MALLLVLLLALGMPALAQSAAPPSAPASAPPAVGYTPRVGVGQEERRLSLEDAVQLALKNNLEIE